ncbi:MAG: glycoside hydrolase family 2 protein [Roseiflexaceae bacterium]|nr:glycoside hydrolase family 2 protein [Roseiflexaceae bacterium]
MQLVPLHSAWQFRQQGSEELYPAQVPGCVHSDLLNNGLIADPFWGSNELELQWIEETNWQYSTTFDLPDELLAYEHVELVADGLDTLATIMLNGQEVARTENMFVGYRFPVRALLRPGRNQLMIHFANPMAYIRERLNTHRFAEWNDPVGGSSNIRKQQCSFGWDWGPRFVTCGIYKDIGFHGWNTSRIAHVQVRQQHANGRVLLKVAPELAGATDHAGLRVRCRLSLGDQAVAHAEGSTLELAVEQPQLWWPNGLGEQPLYSLEVELLQSETILDVHRQRIGLRTIVLDRHADEWGESFQFVVNGLAIFAKGANWIPAHSFVAAVAHADYENLLRSAVEANMNMLRVWGGGIYELDAFYDLCDELGLLVWQDFMFACSLYPGDQRFLGLVEQEAAYQVPRLANHACLALWCGNNEIEQMAQEIQATPERKAAYEQVFYEILPAAVATYDAVTAYWPASPHNPEGYEKGHNNERAGDTHFWEVWHARAPVKRYEQMKFRFCSEFGMQSYSSPAVAATFCPPEEMNVFGPAMENHQKNAAGNQIILDYISRLYRYPKDYAALAYVSQLNQAYCMRVGIEHFRRSMPRTMGALYWQLNDCWPVFSWSSLEFGGRWKALHYEARRFFAPALVSAHLPGDESAGKGNYIVNTMHQVQIYTVYDGLAPQNGTVRWALYSLDNKIIKQGKQDVALRYGESVHHETLDLADAIERHGRPSLYVRLWLEVDDQAVSQQTVFFTAPRFLNLQRAAVQHTIRPHSDSSFEIEFSSPVFQHRVAFDLAGVDYRASDNFFDLYPGVAHRVVVLTAKLSEAELSERLSIRSLVDSY